MIFGLLSFVFRLSSRREMNRELTGAAVNENLRKLFPELDSIPHADTLARLLEKTNPDKIESAHIGLVRTLINGKKFTKLLINNCFPISIDGAQKLFRNGLLHDSNWLQRTVDRTAICVCSRSKHYLEKWIKYTTPNGVLIYGKQSADESKRKTRL
jgi:hypothetical protein